MRKPATQRTLRLLLALACLLPFVPRLTAQTTNTGVQLLVADFNHDGIPDVLTLPAPSSTTAITVPAAATISFGTTPYGTFNPTTIAVNFPAACISFSISALNVGELLVADFNGDGMPDLYFNCQGNSGQSIASGVMLGNGDGTFKPPVLIALSNVRISMVGDLNHDGKLDLLLINRPSTDSSAVSLAPFTGNGDGTFTAGTAATLGTSTLFNPSTGLGIEGQVLADLNGDGYPDLVLDTDVISGPASVNIFANNKDGSFGTVTSGTTLPTKSTNLGTYGTAVAFRVYAANIYSSAIPDLVLPGAITNPDGTSNPGIVLLKNLSAGSTLSFASPVVVSAAIDDLRIGSFTGGALADVAAALGTTITIYANDGSGNLAPYGTLSTPFPSPDSYDTFAVADANNDGYSDLYTASVTSAGTIQLSTAITSGSATASAVAPTLPVGTHALAAAWPGNAILSASNATGSLVVTGVPSTVQLLSSRNPSNQGDSITLTAKAAAASSIARIPTGTLTLMDGSSVLTVGALDATGTLAYTTSALTQGTHTLTAVYAGDAFFATATSTPITQVVNHTAAVASILTWPTPAAISYGTPLGPVQLDATAATAAGTAIPGLFTYTPAAGTLLAAGTQTLSVLFTPTSFTSFLPATQTVSLTVLPVTSATTLTLSAATIAADSPVTLTATIPGTTSGQVRFCDALASTCTDAHLLGLAQITSASTAILRVIPAPGIHSYKAVFVGTKSVNASTSGSQSLTVTSTLATTTTLTQTGAAGNYTLTAITSGVAALAPTGKLSFVDRSSNNAILGNVSLGAAKSTLSLRNTSNPATSREPEFIAIGDFNNDGRPDLAVANFGTVGFPASGRTLTILLSNGDGTFTPAASPATGNAPASIAVGDFNADGNLDLAVTNQGDNTVTILLGHGDGTFTAASSTLPTGSSPYGIATADFNGDGIADLAIANNGANTVTLLLGNGDGSFTASPTTPATGPQPQSLLAADLNNDGIPDLSIANAGSPGLTILLGKGDGTFTSVSTANLTSLTGGDFPTLASGDFNADGTLDLAVAASNNAVTGSVLLGKGDGTFTVASTLPTDLTYAFSLAVRDFNGDGRSDIALTDDQATTLLLSNGDGTFTPSATSTSGNDDDPDYRALTIADFNGDGVPDLAFLNSDLDALTIAITQLTQAVTTMASNIAPLGPGAHQVVASYPGDAVFAPSTSAPVSLIGLQNTPTLTWAPTVASIPYGTALGPQQLNATATGTSGAAVAGAFTYLPGAGTVLGVGSQTLTVTFTPSDPTYVTVSGRTTLTVTQAKPTLTWPTPTAIAYGIPLSATQLDATVSGVTGAALPGVFTYTPAAGALLTPGTQTLSVAFTPTDVVDYAPITGTTQLVVTGVTLTSITPATATLGDSAKTITLTGSGFVSSSIVQVNGAPIPSTLVGPTTLTAIIPAASFTSVGTLSVTVTDPAISQTTLPLAITVTPGTPAVVLAGPTTTQPGTQPSLSLTLTNPYPVPLTATFTLAFTPGVTPAVDDPAIVFANGTRTFTFTVAANSTAVPPIQFQSGTIAGTITIPLVLTAGGANVTPTTLQPVVIQVPPAIPTVTTATLTRSGAQLTVVMAGFSNTREATQATFHFVGVAGATIDTPDITIPVAGIFTTWFSSAASDQYGSSFTYTQPFTLSDTASNIASVQITLTNSVGASSTQTAQ